MTKYYKDNDGNWWKTTWAEQCPERCIFGECQGVKGHKGIHWSYRSCGSFIWRDNDADPKYKHEHIAGGVTPPGDKHYVNPIDMFKHHYMEHSDTVRVEDIEKIELLNKGECEDEAFIDMPVVMDDLDPKLREELQNRIEETRKGCEQLS
jgi:hypothetical protein